ncbi:hypothetical protein [Nitrosophilus alvini]|uniref:hypothetical protein n=1 Tax=Nitrosophilus alvini TaxID=2714855 RepID=UPI00190B7CA5|nr:hypothetical protein [Nitrosophilus alvini]
MKKFLFLIFAIFISGFAKKITIKDVVDYYNKGYYQKACLEGNQIFNKIKKNEDLVTLYAFSCLKADYIDRLAVPIIALRKTKRARANAAYFSAILMQKKLLYHALLDNIDISGLKLPETDYILSKIFTMFTKKEYDKKNGIYVFKDPDDSEITYKMYIDQGRNHKKIVILKFKKDKLIKKYQYW